MKITKVVGREIYDSRGWPTVECQIEVGDSICSRASVPSGLSKSTFAAQELRDNDERLFGMGVTKALENIENIIGPAILDRVPDTVDIDLLLKEVDGTEDKSRLGANAMLAVSIAVLRAQAQIEEMPAYELIARLCNFETVTIPFPMFNIINGGVHADNKLSVQEIMVTPMGDQSFRQCLESGISLFHTFKNLLIKKGMSTLVGDEGGFAPKFSDTFQALDLLMEAIEEVKKQSGTNFIIALDMAATQLYNPKTQLYTVDGKQMAVSELLSFYKNLIEKYPIFVLEDGLSDTDWDGWILMTRMFGDQIQVVGDDIFATNPARVLQGIKDGVSNSVLVKPNQIGTITETLQTISLCKEYERNIIVSHRSGETIDPFIVDLAVGTSAGQIKAGGCSRGERLSKYNSLLRIEDDLMLNLLGI